MTAATLVTLFSVLFPSRMWYAPGQPMKVTVRAPAEVRLVLTDFRGTSEQKGGVEVAGEKTVDLLEVFPALGRTAGTYVLYAVPKGKGKDVDDFVGTPLVISVRPDRRPGAPPDPMVTRVEPLRYAVMRTSLGEMTVAFYHDAAPTTADNFLRLSEQGFYEGLRFNRVVPHFVAQAGDPRGDDTGGPGYQIDAEFSDQRHEEGVLSMARGTDPNEAPGVAPRPEYANSAGSQFFLCLDYANTRVLDRSYTAFARVTAGLDVVRKIAAAPLADPKTYRPADPPVIQKIEVLPVAPGKNPYADLRGATRPATREAAKQP